MTSTVQSLAPAHAIVEVVHTGDVSASDIRTVARQVRDLLQGMDKWHVLSDFRAATSAPGALEIMNLMDGLKHVGVGPGFRQAILWPEDEQARLALDMYRTSESNHGFNAKAFGDREDAIAWLES
jgi:hypothetical protein